MQLKKPVAYWFALVLAILALPQLSRAQDFDFSQPVDTSDLLVAKGINPYTITDAVVRERLAQLTGCLQLRTNAIVKGYIKTYVQIKPDKARRMLGKRLTFFPIFEQKLKEHGLPADLKYLAVVESALNPKAVSPVGATGLWQFMPYTGSDYGLRQNGIIDERIDPVEATDAAMRYLKDLYRQYNDWALVLAAYNSGPGRVNAAIKRAHSRNFWNIQPYLPAETQNYVPAFIAASYICNFFQLHGLVPEDPDLDQQLTDYVRVFESLSFRDISDASGVDYSTIKALNPGYKRDYVPANANGHYVVLPKRVMPAFIRYLNSLGGRNYSLEGNTDYVNGGVGGDGRYAPLTVRIQQPESIESFAKRTGLCGEHVKAWNKLGNNYLYAGQSVTVWRPVYVQKHQNFRIDAPAQASRNRKSESVVMTGGRNKGASELASADLPKPVAINTTTGAASFQWHTVRRNESLEDVARQYAVSVDQLRKLNNLSTVKFGMRLKVRLL
jgi:membrane-bound lytic murein transglycosylase D